MSIMLKNRKMKQKIRQKDISGLVKMLASHVAK